MAKNQKSLINGDLTFTADVVQASLKISDYSAGLDHTSTEGWIQAATLSPAGDQSFSANIETEAVDTGGIITTKDDIVQRIQGEASFSATDLNPWMAKYAMGTKLDIQWQTASSGAGTVSSATAGEITLSDTTQAATFSNNDIAHVELGGTVNPYKWPVIIDKVVGDKLRLKYAMPGIPAASSAVTKLDGYNIWHGGNEVNNLHVMVQLDFPKGDQHILDILKCSMTGGFTRNLGGVVKTPSSLKMYGTQQTVGSLADQVVVAVSRVQFPNT